MSGSIPPLVLRFVADGIARAKRNVENDLPFEAGSDPDAILAALGIEPRPAVFDPHTLSVDFFTEATPLHLHPAKRKRPAA